MAGARSTLVCAWIRRSVLEVDKENTRLRKLVANLSLDKAILKEVAEGKY
jgi:hypothetical protein